MPGVKKLMAWPGLCKTCTRRPCCRLARPTHPAPGTVPSFKQVTALFSGYVASMLASYAAAPATGWRSKDCAYYLVTI